MMTPTAIRAQLEQRKGKRSALQSSVTRLRDQVDTYTTKQGDLVEAQGVVQTVAQATQKELEFHVSELCTLAMAAVFPDPYQLCLDFVLKRNRSEALLSFRRGDDGEKVVPGDASGGGPVDVAAFALRVSLWTLQTPRSRPTIVLDEPFRFVSRDLQDQASAVLKEISGRLGLQLIIITHEPNLLECADRVFTVTQAKGISEVAVG